MQAAVSMQIFERAEDDGEAFARAPLLVSCVLCVLWTVFEQTLSGRASLDRHLDLAGTDGSQGWMDFGSSGMA